MDRDSISNMAHVLIPIILLLICVTIDFLISANWQTLLTIYDILSAIYLGILIGRRIEFVKFDKWKTEYVLNK